MALIPKFATSQANQEGTELYFNEGTGTYDAADNVGGFGAPNPERNTIAIFLIVEIIASDNVRTPISVANDTPLSVTQWTVDVVTGKDGWYQATQYQIPVKTGSESAGDIVYDSVAQEIQRFDDPGYTTLEVSDLATASISLKATKDEPVDFMIGKELNRLSNELELLVDNNQSRTPEADEIRTRQLDNFMLGYGANQDFCAGSTYEFADKIETITDEIERYS